MKFHVLSLVSITLSSFYVSAAQPTDDTQLKQVIIFSRHSVRAPVTDNSTLNNFSVQPYPVFDVQAGYLTQHGQAAETILGGYYRLWLTQEKLLSGNDSADAANVYFRANIIERTILTAQKLASGMLPAASVNVTHYDSNQSDPLFDPVGAGVAHLDQATAVAAVAGRLGGDASALQTVYAPELALLRSVLFQYPGKEGMIPTTPGPAVDVTSIPFAITSSQLGLSVGLGGLTWVDLALDPFVMEYADGMPLSSVGWGQLNQDDINEILRLSQTDIDLEYRTPYLDKIESSNLASHIARTMAQASTGTTMTGAIGLPSTKAVVLVASDTEVGGLAGLFHLDWILPGYIQDFCSPGGAIVFQLRQSQSTGAYIVRASYVGQTMDQLRNLTPLTLDKPPAIAPVFIPGCSTDNATFDCPLAQFLTLAQQVIDPQSASLLD